MLLARLCKPDASPADGHPSVMLQPVSSLLPAPLNRILVSVSLGVLDPLARLYMLQYVHYGRKDTLDATPCQHACIAGRQSIWQIMQAAGRAHLQASLDFCTMSLSRSREEWNLLTSWRWVASALAASSACSKDTRHPTCA